MKRTLILVLLTTIVGMLGSVPDTAIGSGVHSGVAGPALAVVSSSPPANQPLTPTNTSFTYQGSLKDGVNPANGQYDFQFKLYDALTGGNQVGPLLTFTNQTVTNGLFTLALNFGTGVLTGDARWLEIAVRVANIGNYTTLSPRQPLTATPYASSLVPASTVSGASQGAILTTLNSSTGPALMGVGSGGIGLYGSSSDSAGLYATSTYSSAINARNNGNYPTIYSNNSGNGPGLAGYSSMGNGVYGTTSSLYNAGVSGYSNGSYGFGVYAQSENGPGLYATSTYSYGVQALNNNGNAALYGKNLGSGMGVAGYSGSGTGVYGQGPANGTWGFSSTGNGVYGQSSSGYGVSGQSTSGSGIYASSSSSSGNGVYAVNTSSTGGTGVYAGSGGTNGYGLYGSSIGASGTGVYASSTGPNSYGVYASNTGSSGYGVYATSNGPAISGTSVGSDGVRGNSTNGFGVAGYSATQNGVVGTSGSADGVWAFSSSSYAGYFSGDVVVTGNCCAMAEGTTQIDDPLDPANKYLNQSVVASPDMLEVYRGHVTLDASGSATVQLPAYFEALNRDFDYQLTPVGAPMPNLYVAQEVQGNTFNIAGGKPGSKVSWQVTGVRQDVYATAHPIQPEQDKPASEQGKYLHPQELGKPVSQGVDYDKIQQLQQSQQPEQAGK